jgi:hypothetical protein
MLPLPRSGRHNESYRGLPEASDSTANIVEPEGRRTAGAGWDFRKDSEKGEVRFQVVVEGGKGDENIGVASSK